MSTCACLKTAEGCGCSQVAKIIMAEPICPLCSETLVMPLGVICARCLHSVIFVLVPDTENGGYVVFSPSVPGLATQGNDVPDALLMAADAFDCIMETGPYAVKPAATETTPATTGQVHDPGA